MQAIPAGSTVIRLKICSFEDQFTPPVEDPERFNGKDTCSPGVKGFINPIPVRGKRIGEEEVAIITKNIHSNIIADCAPGDVSYFNCVGSSFFWCGNR